MNIICLGQIKNKCVSGNSLKILGKVDIHIFFFLEKI